MKPRNVFELMHIVAQKLAGQPIEISQDPPPYVDREGKTTQGCVYKDATGKVIMHVLRGTDQEAFLNFLHEVAHAKLHIADMPLLTDPQPRSITVPAESYTTPAHITRETQARNQADQWLAIARKHAASFPGSEFEQLLQAIYRFGLTK